LIVDLNSHCQTSSPASQVILYHNQLSHLTPLSNYNKNHSANTMAIPSS